MLGLESSLPFVTFLDSDIVVSPFQVDLEKVFGFLKPFEKIINSGNRIGIRYHVFIDISVVLAESEFPTGGDCRD